MSHRRTGITPVVAIVLLLMMTVAASGGAYAWMQTLQHEAQEDARGALSTSVDVKDVRCGRGAVEIAVKNEGRAAVGTDDVDLYIYDSRDDLAASRSGVDMSALSFGPGDFISPAFFVPALLSPGEQHRVELVFQDDQTVSATCLPETAGADPVALWTFDDEPEHKPVIVYDENELIYIRNDEDGTFGPLESFGSAYTKENDGGVAMADFDQDGIYDIIFYGQNHNVYLWTGIRDGPPTGAPQQIASLGSSKAQGMTAGDWDEDGDMDVIEIQDGDLIENQGGSWTTTSLSFDGHRDVAGADFDEDGCEDIVYDPGSGTRVDFRPGNCDGTFGASTTAVTTPANSNWVAAGDFDDDGNQDIVVVPEQNDGDADLYTGNADGTFTLSNGNFTSFDDGNHRNPVASDLDGDGDLDLILAEHNGNNVWYVEGNADGTFQAEVNLGDTGQSALGSAAPGNDFVLDHAGNNDGARLGPAWTFGRDGAALDFDGSDDRIEVADTGTSTLDVDNLTITAWVRTTGSGSGNMVVNKEGTYEFGAGTNGVSLAVAATGCGGWCNGWMIDTAGSIPSDTWTHVAGTWDGDVGRVYIDGELVATADPGDGDGPVSASDRNLAIGARDIDQTFSSHFDGVIDEVAIYDGTLH